MSLAAMAIIGRLGNPIYLQSFEENLPIPLLFDIYTTNPSFVPDDDFFCDSLVEETAEQRSEWPCRMKYQFALFTAYERLTAMLEGGWKGAGIGPDACWCGLVCNVDGFHAYGEWSPSSFQCCYANQLSTAQQQFLNQCMFNYCFWRICDN